ncbi:class I SAM-dependent methyltransferase [Terrabacter sp. 2TAF16]|jgi:SAM-dependent methyltransferase|uniref:class I SAM-dependent methyltransferase n=1 Tax=Terrabacter sp. 2TAF16 TaxID=3233008 RepID=UPI003F98EA3D
MSDSQQLVSKLVDSVIDQFPVHRGFLEQAVEGATEDERDRLGSYLRFCLSKGLSLEYLAESYLTILGDTLDEQEYFRRHGHYRHSTFADVAESVYHDRDYMDRYMYGLAITTFLWPNHVEMSRFLRRSLPRDRGGRYLEVGPGHGFLLMAAIETGSFDDFLGVDLSPASVEQTRTIVEHFHPDAPVRVELRDFLTADDLAPSSFDAVVMGEVLEHVEQPEVFLRRIADLAKPGAFVFVTTCVNAPAVDHIYLWRTTDELESMISDCGLSIVEPLRLPYEGKTLDQSRDEQLPINVAYVLAKAGA